MRLHLYLVNVYVRKTWILTPNQHLSQPVGEGILTGSKSNLKACTHFSNDQSSLIAAIKATEKVTSAETEKGVPLALLVKDLEPWYSERTRKQPAEKQDEKRCVLIHETGSIH